MPPTAHPYPTGGAWPNVAAIVVAAGDGTRFGSRKQFGVIANETLVAHAVRTVAEIASSVVCVLPGDIMANSESADPLDAAGLGSVALSLGDRISAVAGGATRADSVRAALETVADSFEILVIHDAARPLASTGLCRAVVAAVVDGADAAVPGIPVVDTIKQVVSGCVVGTHDRTTLVRVQTPQAFSLSALREAHRDGGDATDDAALVERAGGTVRVIAGEEHNLKVTSPDDLELAAWWLERLSPTPRSSGRDLASGGHRRAETAT